MYLSKTMGKLTRSTTMFTPPNMMKDVSWSLVGYILLAICTTALCAIPQVVSPEDRTSLE